MTIKLDQIRTFIAVAESGSLADAAKLLGKTSSAVSIALKQFTGQYGDGLFETDRKSTLTTDGQFVLTQSRNAIGHFDDAMNVIGRYRSGQYGSVRIAAVPSFSTRLLPKIVRRFKAELPAVDLELRDADSDSIIQAVRDGTVDLGVASKLGASHDLKTELLLEEPFGVVCRQDNPLSQINNPITWGQLQSQPFINNGLCAAICNPNFELAQNNSSFYIHNTATLLTFVAQGFGVTLLPQSAISDNEDLCFLRLQDKTAIRRLFIMQHPQQQLNPAATVFKSQLASVSQALLKDDSLLVLESRAG